VFQCMVVLKVLYVVSGCLHMVVEVGRRGVLNRCDLEWHWFE